MAEQFTEKERDHIEILWQEGKEGARILRVFGNCLDLVLPDTIAGRPVTEIGAYCFSASERFSFEDGALIRISGNNTIIEEVISQVTMPAICGNYVESLTLPDTINVLGNAAFYNCRKVKVISFGKEIMEIGADVFMNCTQLKKLIIRGDVREKNGLFRIMERISAEIEVAFYPNLDEEGCQCIEDCQCTLYYPEYYQWRQEVVSGIFFNQGIDGQGLRLRQSFQDDKVDFRKYDLCFPHLSGEMDETIYLLAIDRLRWPVELLEEDEIMYKKAVEARMDVAISHILSQRDLEELKFLCERFKPDHSLLSQWMDACIRKDWVEANVYLMEAKQMEAKQYKGSFAEKKFDFDDF